MEVEMELTETIKFSGPPALLLSCLTDQTLKTLCRKVGLATKGTRDDRMDRLNRFYASKDHIIKGHNRSAKQGNIITRPPSLQYHGKMNYSRSYNEGLTICTGLKGY
ncbi:hypothetical protein PROFUN_16118 [Planoprotostelium fungivorum]|uniref:SAP domain-containing protein n=1 Tax=Planoprotostelium fungivorum TaxID=1890364 RepID=A0A2P6MSN6_9EUKA|nr:hypothetical protein PROFUN_16118 [Planoprotostelium fungivorum]